MNRNRLCSSGLSWLGRFRHPATASQKGNALIWIALMLPLLVGFVGLVVDVGNLLETRRKLQTGVDSAALAGAQELPMSPPNAQTVAYNYLGVNFPDALASASASVSTTYYPNDTITVSAVRNDSLFLMRVFGHTNSDVAATATAIVRSLTNGQCVLPLGYVEEDGDIYNGVGYQFGDFTILKVGAGEGKQGNFGPLRIYGNGNSDYRDGIAMLNCPRTVSVGDTVKTLPGNQQAAQVGADGFAARIGSDPHTSVWDVVNPVTGAWVNPGDPNCPRIALVPIITGYTKGGTDDVTILQLVPFFISSYQYIPPDPLAKGGQGHMEVAGWFINIVVSSDSTGNYTGTGTRVVRLIR